MSKLTQLDLMIIENTLWGSLRLADGGTLFNFTAEARKRTMKKIIQLMENCEVDLQEKSDE